MVMKAQHLPVKMKEIDVGENEFCEWAGGSMQGWRPRQEDAHICKTDLTKGIHLFAVFDGHGGPGVAKFCEKHFPEELVKHAKYVDGSDYKAALHDTCLKMDELLLLNEGLQEMYELNTPESDRKVHDWDALRNKSDVTEFHTTRPQAGCTANICLFVGNHLIVANVGDSRTCILDENCGEPLSTDHKPDLDSEKERVIKAGGAIIQGRVNFNLTLTRAIGDLNYKSNKSKTPEEQVIIAVPEFKETDIKKDNNKFVVMGCDGIWEKDDSNTSVVNQFKWNIPKNMPLKDIIDEKIFERLIGKKENSEYGTDNMTCICIKFK